MSTRINMQHLPMGSSSVVDVWQLEVGLLHDSGWCQAVEGWSPPWLWLISGSWRLVSSMTLVDVRQLNVSLPHDSGWCQAVEGWSLPWPWLMSGSWRLVFSMTLVDLRQLKVGLLHDSGWCQAVEGWSPPWLWLMSGSWMLGLLHDWLMSGSWRLVSSMTLVDIRQLEVGLLHDSGWCQAVEGWSPPWPWLMSGSWRLVSSMTLELLSTKRPILAKERKIFCHLETVLPCTVTSLGWIWHSCTMTASRMPLQAGDWAGPQLLLRKHLHKWKTSQQVVKVLKCTHIAIFLNALWNITFYQEYTLNDYNTLHKDLVTTTEVTDCNLNNKLHEEVKYLLVLITLDVEEAPFTLNRPLTSDLKRSGKVMGHLSYRSRLSYAAISMSARVLLMGSVSLRNTRRPASSGPSTVLMKESTTVPSSCQQMTVIVLK